MISNSLSAGSIALSRAFASAASPAAVFASCAPAPDAGPSLPRGYGLQAPSELRTCMIRVLAVVRNDPRRSVDRADREVLSQGLLPDRPPRARRLSLRRGPPRRSWAIRRRDRTDRSTALPGPAADRFVAIARRKDGHSARYGRHGDTSSCAAGHSPSAPPAAAAFSPTTSPRRPRAAGSSRARSSTAEVAPREFPRDSGHTPVTCFLTRGCRSTRGPDRRPALRRTARTRRA